LTCKPGSVGPDSLPAEADRPPDVVTIHLGRLLPAASCNQPGWLASKAAGPKPASPLFGLAPGGVCHAVPVAGAAVRSCRTLSPLPRPGPRRFAFCGTFPGVAPAGR